jgi:hypothetical protein
VEKSSLRDALAGGGVVFRCEELPSCIEKSDRIFSEIGIREIPLKGEKIP